MKNKTCVLECHLPSKLLKQFLIQPQRALGQGKVKPGAPLCGLVDRKRETETAEIWELSDPDSGSRRKAQAKSQGHSHIRRLVH